MGGRRGSLVLDPTSGWRQRIQADHHETIESETPAKIAKPGPPTVGGLPAHFAALSPCAPPG